MRTINKLRATLLSKSNVTGFEPHISKVIEKLFLTLPSYTEQVICSECKMKQFKRGYAVTLVNEIFRGDYSNLEKAFMQSFPDIIVSCAKCDNDIRRKYEYAPHMFIQVFKIPFEIYFHSIEIPQQKCA